MSMSGHRELPIRNLSDLYSALLSPCTVLPHTERTDQQQQCPFKSSLYVPQDNSSNSKRVIASINLDHPAMLEHLQPTMLSWGFCRANNSDSWGSNDGPRICRYLGRQGSAALEELRVEDCRQSCRNGRPRSDG